MCYMQRKDLDRLWDVTLAVLLVSIFAAFVYVSGCTRNERKIVLTVADVAPDACELLAAELPPGTCDATRDAADVLTVILDRRRGRPLASGSPAASAPPAGSR